jgi:hypothetical protein
MTQDNQTNFRPLPVILMVLILAAVAFGGWWLKSHPSANSTPINQPVQPIKIPDKKSISLTLFVPNENAMLEKHSFNLEDSTSAHFTDLAKVAFAALMKKAPYNFPKGTELLDVKTKENGTAILDFNSKFADASFWQGSATTMMGTYSIVNTITALPADDFKAQQVQFLIEGKPIAVLGELDVQDPLKPDMQWLQKN